MHDLDKARWIREAARLSGVGEDTLRQWHHSGRLRTVPVGRSGSRVKVTLRAVYAALEENASQAARGAE